MTSIALVLEPLDTLFFRDARPFGAAMRGRGGLPLPQTLAGALRTSMLEQVGVDVERLSQLIRDGRSLGEATQACGCAWLAEVVVRGPFLARVENGASEVLLPAPATLQRPRDGSRELVMLRPLETAPPGWGPPCAGLLPVWARTRTRLEPARGYLSSGAWKRMVAEDVTPAADDVVSPDDLYGFVERTGIGIDPERASVQQGAIYATSQLVLKPGVSFYAELTLPAGAPGTLFAKELTVAFGGEGRRVVARRGRSLLPAAEPREGTKGAWLMLTTPTLVDSAFGIPRALEALKLAALVHAGSEPVSGWDLARRGPKPTRFTVGAGSVYFVRTPPGRELTSLADDAEHARQGWGSYISGGWS